jgi:hypothetical protein
MIPNACGHNQSVLTKRSQRFTMLFASLVGGLMTPQFTEDVAEALQAVDSPIEAITTAFTNPKKFFKALNNVGADLTPPVRKKAQSVVISAIIVVQIAGNIAAMLVRKI